MAVHVITGWNDPGFNLYGRNFAEGFAEFWPQAYNLTAYTESPVDLPRGGTRSLWECPGVREFIDRWKNDPDKTGRQENALWGRRQKGKPYNFRFDAVKFCRQMFIPSHESAVRAVQAIETGRDPADDIIVWLDGDVKTDAMVPTTFVEDALGDADVVHLGRMNTHSEIGFWACRNNDRGRQFMDGMAAMYSSGDVFKLAEWHSAWVFDSVLNRDRQRKRDPLRVKNLTPNGQGHVWMMCALREFSDHLKGDARKRKGASPERKFMHPKRKS
jgi:hypothetical protein